MKPHTDFHSRLDIPELPVRASIWKRLGYQLQRQLLLTFYPHPDSFSYPSRQRTIFTACLIFVGTVVLGWYWWPLKHGYLYYQGALLVLLGLSFFSVLQLRLRLIPGVRATLVFPVLMWFSLPGFFFFDYLIATARYPALEYLCVMLLLYANLLHWRVAAVGMASAAVCACAVFYAMGGSLFWPQALDVFAISASVLGGLLSSYTFAKVDSRRYAQNMRIVSIVSKRMNAALGVQLALSATLRHEAQSTADETCRRRLLDVVQCLDWRANLIRAELQEMEKDASTVAQLGSTQLLQVGHVLPAVLEELEDAYALPAASFSLSLQAPADEGLVLQGEKLETVQLLASVWALMSRNELRAGQPENAAINPSIPSELISSEQTALQVRWVKRDGQVELSLARGQGASALAVLDAEQDKSSRSEHLAWAERLLPAYSIYVLKKMGARIYFANLQAGQPQSLRIVWPKPEWVQNRLLSDRPLTLLQMYGDKALE